MMNGKIVKIENNVTFVEFQKRHQTMIWPLGKPHPILMVGDHITVKVGAMGAYYVQTTGEE